MSKKFPRGPDGISEDKVDRDVAAEREKECLHNLSLSRLCSCICALSARALHHCSTFTSQVYGSGHLGMGQKL